MLVAFDLLQHDGADLRDLPLIERKQRLARLLGRGKRSAIQYSEHLTGEGSTAFDHVRWRPMAFFQHRIVGLRASGELETCRSSHICRWHRPLVYWIHAYCEARRYFDCNIRATNSY